MAQIKEWRYSDPKPLEKDIAELEKQLGGSIAADYRKFLMEVNAAVPVPRVGFWRQKAGEVWLTDVTFITFQRSDDDGLRRVLSEFIEASILGYLGIGITGSEELICLDCVKHVGRISLTNNCTDDEYREYTRPMERIADSFTAFLEMLAPIIPEYCPIRELGLNGTPEQLEEYLSAGKSIDAKSLDDMTIAQHAVAGQNLCILERCALRGANLQGTLCLAVGSGQLSLVKRLVEFGLDVNNDQFDPDDCPLDCVVSQNREMRDLLLSLGATKSKYERHIKKD